MSDIQKEIRTLVDGFVEELSNLMQAAIAEASAGSAPRRRTTKKAKKKAVKKGRKKRAAKKVAKKVAKKSGRRKKRSPEQLAKLEGALLKEIKKKSGLRMEDLAKILGVSTKDLMLPAKKLLSEKKVKTKGQTRATQYFAK